MSALITEKKGKERKGKERKGKERKRKEQKRKNRKEQKRKDYAFWRQFNEKPSIILGCPRTDQCTNGSAFLALSCAVSNALMA